MNISINPTYYCNFRCKFCYLTEEQLSNRKVTPVEIIKQKVKEIQTKYDIGMVDLYGGEIGLLSYEYISSLCNTLNDLGIDDINIVTNLSMINDVINHPSLYITVSYDFEHREQHDRVWKNMALLEKPFSILILATPEVIENDVSDMIMQLNLLSNLSSVEIKPYSTNQANSHNISFVQFEKFVKKWIDSDVNKKFQFINQNNLEDVITSKRNSFSDDHIYITPEGNFAVLEFDLNDNEYFLDCTLEEYERWCENEKLKINKNRFCNQCEYKGRCLSEHLRNVKSLDKSCNGFKHLIDWYKNDFSGNKDW